MTASLSLLVPTHREDRPLKRCLDSIVGQLEPQDEVIVVGDTHDGPLPTVEALVASYGFTYLAHDAGHHCYGHCQLNYGLEQAHGDYIHCNDDDDVWTPTALESFRNAMGEVPVLFRFKSYLGPIFWARQGFFARDWIGGHCLFTPRAMAGRFTCAYNGDFDWVESTVHKVSGTEIVWRDEIIAIARPA